MEKMYLVNQEDVILRNDKELRDYFKENCYDDYNNDSDFESYLTENFSAVDIYMMPLDEKESVFDSFMQYQFRNWVDDCIVEVYFYYNEK